MRMTSKSINEEILEHLLQVLTELSICPKNIQQGNIRQLKGGLKCVDLEGVIDIDSVILLSKLNSYRTPAHTYKLDYALRGNIKGILPGRKITETKLDLKGMFKKKIEDIEWIVPTEKRAEIYRYTNKTKGISPKPGEVWINGPHQTLTDKLNKERDLRIKIIEYLKEKDRSNLKFTILSDGWGESLRLSGNLWLEPVKMIGTYASKAYLEIVSEIFKHLKEVRRYFGGLTF